jgi:hypothetical protein
VRRDELDDRERLALRRLEQQLRKESPDLARRLGDRAPAVGARFAPTRWHWAVHLTLGLLLLGAGSLVAVTSATVLGLVLLAAAAIRWLADGDEVLMSPEAARQWGPAARGPRPGRLTLLPRSPGPTDEPPDPAVTRPVPGADGPAGLVGWRGA